MRTQMTRRAAVGAAVFAAAALLAGCASGGKAPGDNDAGKAEGNEGDSSSTGGEILFWDPYPQRQEDSEWAQLVASCAPEGTTIIRTSAPQTDLFNELTTAVREGTAPDVAVLDNPMMPEAVAAGLVAKAEEVGISAGDLDENLMGPGVVDGEVYGIPFGSNALGLYYNKAVLDDAGVDPSGINNWDDLNGALSQVVGNGDKGITFSGVAGEEGVFQFLPWFWGSGASFDDIASAEAISAGTLVSSWIGDGYAPRSAVTDNQSASWDLFLTGEYGFAENGSWQAASAEEADFEVGVIPIPSASGGVAPVATGGEFAIVPVQKDDADRHYANAKAVIECLTTGDTAVEATEALGYLSANAQVRAQQVENNPLWEPWVSIVEGAQGRTSDVGAEYVNISARLSEALQGALNAAGNESAVEQAFQEAAGN